MTRPAGYDDEPRTAQRDQDLHWDDDPFSDDLCCQDDYDDEPSWGCDTCQDTGTTVGGDDPCPRGCMAPLELVGSAGADVVRWTPCDDEPPF